MHIESPFNAQDRTALDYAINAATLDFNLKLLHSGKLSLFEFIKVNCWLNEVFYCTEWQLLIELSIGVHTFALVFPGRITSECLCNYYIDFTICEAFDKQQWRLESSSSSSSSQLSTHFYFVCSAGTFARDKIKMKFLPLFFYVFLCAYSRILFFCLAVCVFRLAMEIEFQYENTTYIFDSIQGSHEWCKLKWITAHNKWQWAR